MNTLKAQIQSGKAVHGAWINMGSHVSAEIMGRAGFDWLLIDLEHGAGTESELLHCLQALQSSSATPFIRLPNADPARIKRALDLGVMGIMFPQIESCEQAEAATKAMYYKPIGTRGSASMVRAVEFGKTYEAYSSGLKDRLISMIQVETAEILDEIEAVAKLELVDVLFVGPLDLSISLGIRGQHDHPLYIDALKKTVAAAQEAGKAAGVMMMNLDQYDFYYDLGFRVLASGSDAAFIIRGAANQISRMQELREQKSVKP